MAQAYHTTPFKANQDKKVFFQDPISIEKSWV
jgi:hypothetical protein